MTRAEFERVKGRLVRCGVCPMCGSPFDFEKVRSLVLRCSNPTCGAFYQPTLAEEVERPSASPSRHSGGARLPERDV